MIDGRKRVLSAGFLRGPPPDEPIVGAMGNNLTDLTRDARTLRYATVTTCAAGRATLIGVLLTVMGVALCEPAAAQTATATAVHIENQYTRIASTLAQNQHFGAAGIQARGGVDIAPELSTDDSDEPRDHGRIAFQVNDPKTGDPHVTISNPDGTHARDLSLPVPVGGPRWSPDGRKLLVFSFSPAGVRPATVSPDGSHFRILAAAGFPADMGVSPCVWVPGGARILCEARRYSGDPSRNGIYSLRSSDGGGAVRLTVNPFPASGDFGGGDLPGGVSPDGKSFVFKRARPGPEPTPDQGQSGALFVEKIAGTGLRQITPYGLPNSHDNGVARWAPTGHLILFGSETGSLFTVRPDGRGLHRITLPVPAKTSYAYAPAWAPDGSHIIFGLFRRSAGQADIYTARADGHHLRRVTNTAAFDDLPDWARPA